MRLKVCGMMLLALALGCGDDGDKKQASNNQGGASEKCSEFISTVCDTFAGCAVEAGDVTESKRDSTFDECVSGLEDAFQCDRAVRVTSSFESCLDTLDTLSCDPFYSQLLSGDGSGIPAVCQGVIEVE